MQILMRCLAAASVAAPLLGGTAEAQTVDLARERGAVVCGVNGARAGFSALNSRGEWEGMDVDTCRAVATALLGDASKVEFVKTTSQNRFTALQTGEVDVLIRNVTWTLGRDSAVGIDFVAPTFYDGQAFMVPKAIGVRDVTELSGATVCVLPGSTSEKVVGDVFREHGMEYNPVVIESANELQTAFFSGRCDVWIQTTSGLSAARATKATVPEDYVILPQIYGKDPMGPAVRQDDPKFRDIVAWSVYAMMEAEEVGITSDNVDEMLASGDPNIQRILGVTGNLGEGLGLSNDWAYQIVKQVGNYGEVFERNVGAQSPLKLERGLNDLWTRGGLLYAPPFK